MSDLAQWMLVYHMQQVMYEEWMKMWTGGFNLEQFNKLMFPKMQ